MTNAIDVVALTGAMSSITCCVAATSDRVMIAIAACLHRSSVCAQVRHREPDVVHRRPLGPAGRLLVLKKMKHVRELHDVGVLRPNLIAVPPSVSARTSGAPGCR